MTPSSIESTVCRKLHLESADERSQSTPFREQIKSILIIMGSAIPDYLTSIQIAVDVDTPEIYLSDPNDTFDPLQRFQEVDLQRQQSIRDGRIIMRLLIESLA